MRPGNRPEAELTAAHAGRVVAVIDRAQSESFALSAVTVPDQEQLERVLSDAGEKWLEAHAAGQRGAKAKIEASVRETELELERMEDTHATRD